MTVNELYRALQASIPEQLRCDWDNDGRMCVPEGDRPVRRVLLTLDVHLDALRYAAEHGFDTVISHHPMIFSPVRAVVEENVTASRILFALEHDISVLSFHTRLDAVEGGVNDVLAARLGLRDVAVLPSDEGGLGRIGTLAQPMLLSDFAAFAKDALGAPIALASGEREVSRVALVGGDGKDFIRDAKASGADTFVSGRLSYNTMIDAKDMGINLVELGHFYTEDPVLGMLGDLVQTACPTVHTETYCSNLIKVY